MNGSFVDGVLVPGSPVTISYILNDYATGGVTVGLYSGGTLIKTISSTDNEAGTNAGLNSVVWDGSTDAMTPLAEGAYQVQITASATGYSAWTNITDDGPNFSVEVPRGITVNQNTNSPYYGRVFVANTYTDYGIFKYNADGSPADEGGFSTGGLTWGNGFYSPWKLTVAANDKVYIDDFSADGVLYAFGQTIATNEYCVAIGPNNYPTQDNNPQLSGVAVTGSGPNMQIWMADENPGASAGIVVWSAPNGMAAPSDTGNIAAPISPNDLDEAPYDVAVDTNGYIYTIQFITNFADTSYQLMRFPPYQGTPETTADWAVGSGCGALLESYGIAVDPAASTVAVAVVGTNQDDLSFSPTGSLNLFQATNGQFIANIDQTGGDPYYDVAWDNVGNLYTLDGYSNVWRAYSPPGPNEATTVAVPFVQFYNELTPPVLCNPAVKPMMVNFTLAGQSNVTYVIQQSCDLIHWHPALTNFSSRNDRPICLPACGQADFYRAVTAP